jgi:hypothetical protein
VVITTDYEAASSGNDVLEGTAVNADFKNSGVEGNSGT